MESPNIRLILENAFMSVIVTLLRMTFGFYVGPLDRSKS